MDADAGLFPYQEEGAQWLTTKTRALLADEMGLGKTAQAIVACDRIGATRILVICPAIARLNWQREWHKFSSNMRAITVIETQDGPPSWGTCVICSYDLAARSGMRTALYARLWDVVILDESHYLSHRHTQRTLAIYPGLVIRAERIWCLSGTPARNHAAELYPMLAAFGLWSNGYWAFVRRFCRTRETIYGTKIIGSQRIDELKGLLAPVLLRRRKADVLKDLPSILYTDVVVEPSQVDLKQWYPEVDLGVKREETLLDEIAAQQTAIDAVCSVTRLGEDGLLALKGLQVRTTLSRRYTGLSKTPKVAEMIDRELIDGAYQKIVLFCFHRDVMLDLFARLRRHHPLMVWGGTPNHERDVRVRKFQTQAKFRVFIGNIIAAGTAITLTAAHEVAFVESSWVPADNAQAAMRVHRIGQTEPVRVRFFSVAGSSDEVVQKVLRRKTKDITTLFGNPFGESADSSGTESPPFVNPFSET